MKRFLEWIGLKERLDSITHNPPLVSEGDIWWASIGENVGSEIHGKNTEFSRPVIIFKKLSRSFYFVIPTTTKVHEGTWYVTFHQKGLVVAACLHQARAIDYRRLGSRLGTLDDTDHARIQDAFASLYIKKCSPPSPAGSRENPECN